MEMRSEELNAALRPIQAILTRALTKADPSNVVDGSVKFDKARFTWKPTARDIEAIRYDALSDATATCRSVVECRAALTDELRRLAKQIATPGTKLNQLVTR